MKPEHPCGTPLLGYSEVPVQSGRLPLSVPAQAPVSVFDDSDPNRYYDPANPMGSVKVAGVGVTIKVVQSNKTGKMTVAVNGG